MADIFLSPLVDALIGNLISAATDEIKMLWGVEEEVDRLHRTLSAIQAVLEDAEEKQVTSNVVKNWLCELKKVAYDAEDVVEEFAIEAHRAKLEGSLPKTSKRKQVSRFFSRLRVNKVGFRHEIGLEIKNVRQRLDDIAKERSQFHLKNSDGGRPVEVIERPKTGSLIDESEVIGRDDAKKTLIQILTVDGETGKNFSVIPIVGMGGSGKTTLAQLLYNDTLIVNHGFEIRAWVCVSDSFDVARITKEIIESTTKAQCEFLSIEPLQHKLLDILRGKKFIIVLDDVWNENKIHEWENLCLPLKGGARGSKIIVTTRSDKVAQMMGTVSAHKLGVLSEDDSWRLFEKMAFGGESSKAPQTLVNIGKQILKKCGGLPLAIKTMGALLSSHRNESRWKNILLSKIWELPEGTNDILPALRLSYQHLPTNLKQCFTYCSLFPKDYEFDRDELVELWIGEGFIKPRAGMEMKELGQDLFEDLLSRSFFQSHSRYFNMHDLIHDMAEFFSKEECVKIEGGMSFDMLKNARRTSIINQEEINLIKLDDWDKLNNLRTILKVKRSKLISEHSDDLLDLLLRCKRLRVLSLPKFSIHELPNSIGKLKHLRHLDLSLNGIKRLPASIGGLYNLHTLNLSYCEDLEELPESIGGLYNLQTLNLSSCRSLKELPESVGSGITNLVYLRHLEVDTLPLPSGIGKMSQLVTLPYFKVGIRENECKLGELKDLVNLSRLIRISGLEKVSNKEEAEEANLKKKDNLQEVALEWGGAGNSLNDEDQVLEGLQPHVNIKKIIIREYNGDRLTPSWFSKFDQMITFVNLVDVRFLGCKNCKSLPPLGQLPSLEKLMLVGMEELRILGDEFCGDNGTFPSLKYLTLGRLSSLEKWSGGMEGGEYMPCLLELKIYLCPKLKQLPEKGLPTSLQSLAIWACPILTERCKKFTGEDWPKIFHIPQLKISEEKGRGLRSLLGIIHEFALYK